MALEEPVPLYAPDIVQRLDRLEHLLSDLDVGFQQLALQLTQLRATVCRDDHYGLGRRGLPVDEAFTRRHGLT